MTEGRTTRIVFQDPARVLWGTRLLGLVALLAATAAVGFWQRAPGGGGGALVGAGIAGLLALGFLGPALVLWSFRREADCYLDRQQVMTGWRLLGVGCSKTWSLTSRTRVELVSRDFDVDGLSQTQYVVGLQIEDRSRRVACSRDLVLARRWASALAQALDVPLVDKCRA